MSFVHCMPKYSNRARMKSRVKKTVKGHRKSYPYLAVRTIGLWRPVGGINKKWARVRYEMRLNAYQYIGRNALLPFQSAGGRALAIKNFIGLRTCLPSIRCDDAITTAASPEGAHRFLAGGTMQTSNGLHHGGVGETIGNATAADDLEAATNQHGRLLGQRYPGS